MISLCRIPAVPIGKNNKKNNQRTPSRWKWLDINADKKRVIPLILPNENNTYEGYIIPSTAISPKQYSVGPPIKLNIKSHTSVVSFFIESTPIASRYKANPDKALRTINPIPSILSKSMAYSFCQFREQI